MDQLKQSQEWSGKKYNNGSDLLSDILNALQENELAWPDNFSLLSSEKWIMKMCFIQD